MFSSQISPKLGIDFEIKNVYSVSSIDFVKGLLSTGDDLAVVGGEDGNSWRKHD